MVGLVIGIRWRNADTIWVREESWAADRVVKRVVMVVVVDGYLRLSRLPPMDLAKQVFFSFLEEFVCKLPSVWNYFPKTIGVELADEAREIVVLEVVRKEVTSELRWTPNNKGGVIFTPRDYMVCARVIYKLVSFG